MDYSEELESLKHFMQDFIELKKEFYKEFKRNHYSERLDSIAFNANNFLDKAINLRKSINHNIIIEKEGYPRNGSSETAEFDKIAEEITKLAKQRKHNRKRKTFKKEGIKELKQNRENAEKEIRETEKKYRERLKRLENRKTKTKKMLKETPEFKWWKPKGIKERVQLSKTVAEEAALAWTQKLALNNETRINRTMKNWNTKKRFGLTTHFIGRIKSRKLRKMRP